MANTAGAQSIDVAVLGGGVIGLACAFVLAGEHRRVVVLERGGIGTGASGAALGVLMPHAPTQRTPLADVQLDSLAAMPGFVAEVEGASGMSCGYRRAGRIEILHSPAAAAMAPERIDAAAEHWARFGGAPLRRIDNLGARRLAPHIAHSDHGYLFDAVTAQIEPVAFVAALATACRARGVEIREQTGATAIAGGAGGLRITTRAGPVDTARAVSATGVGLGEALGPQLDGLPISGVKGEAMVWPDRGSREPRPVVTGPGGFALSRDDGLYIGSTSDRTAPLDATVTREGRTALIGRARKLVNLDPAHQRARLWSGFRPATRDGQPVLGPHPQDPRIIVAGGFFKIGLSLAPAAATAVAAYVGGRTPAAPWDAFTAERFVRTRA